MKIDHVPDCHKLTASCTAEHVNLLESLIGKLALVP
jgi:hypothetical protein